VTAGRLALVGLALAGSVVGEPRVDTAGDRLRRATVTAVAHEHTPAAAERDGFRLVSRTGRVAHYVASSRMADGRVADPSAPEGLMFDGDHLLAAFFLLDAPGEQPPMSAHVPGWHAHSSCVGGGGVGLPRPDRSCPAGTDQVASAAMLHVWVAPPDEGPFAATSTASSFRCALVDDG
jgi:hypothetical protein